MIFTALDDGGMLRNNNLIAVPHIIELPMKVFADDFDDCRRPAWITEQQCLLMGGDFDN